MSLLMAAPGSVEGRDTGRVGFNGGSTGRGRGKQTAWPLSSLEDSQTALETQDVGMQAGRMGLDTHTPASLPLSRAHTHTKLHSLHSFLNPFLSAVYDLEKQLSSIHKETWLGGHQFSSVFPPNVRQPTQFTRVSFFFF